MSPARFRPPYRLAVCLAGALVLGAGGALAGEGVGGPEGAYRGAIAPESAARTDAERPQSETVLRAQRALAGKGYEPGPADGVMDGRVREALRAFQLDEGLAPTGGLNVATARALSLPPEAMPAGPAGAGAGSGSEGGFGAVTSGLLTDPDFDHPVILREGEPLDSTLLGEAEEPRAFWTTPFGARPPGPPRPDR
ncbi:MAG: peptidoglycan-binding protein [Alphaproteobacteria bacterium]|nr:peptidoglycan-binding protein [Alphaproteobacteria bacterium]